MRLANTAHTSRPWANSRARPRLSPRGRVGAADARRPSDFPRLVAQLAAGNTSTNPSRAARALFAIRWKVGELLGWDDADPGDGARRPALRDRLPADLRDAPSGPDFETLPFTSLYLLDDEWAAELVNRTVHAVMHIGWVPDATGGYRGQMAVLVKPCGRLGAAYMARDHAVPARDRLPAADARDRAKVAGGPATRRTPARASCSTRPRCCGLATTGQTASREWSRSASTGTGARSSSARGDRAQGAGALVASGGCTDHRCRRHARAGEGTPDAWSHNSGHRRRRSRRVPRSIGGRRWTQTRSRSSSARSGRSTTAWRASRSSRNGHGSSTSARGASRVSHEAGERRLASHLGKWAVTFAPLIGAGVQAALRTRRPRPRDCLLARPLSVPRQPAHRPKTSRAPPSSHPEVRPLLGRPSRA